MIVRRVEAGEAADVVLLPHDAALELAVVRKVVGDSITELASSRVGVAIRAGAPRPDIATRQPFDRHFSPRAVDHPGVRHSYARPRDVISLTPQSPTSCELTPSQRSRKIRPSLIAHGRPLADLPIFVRADGTRARTWRITSAAASGPARAARLADRGTQAT
jgi:hypothetical protein